MAASQRQDAALTARRRRAAGEGEGRILPRSLSTRRAWKSSETGLPGRASRPPHCPRERTRTAQCGCVCPACAHEGSEACVRNQVLRGRLAFWQKERRMTDCTRLKRTTGRVRRLGQTVAPSASTARARSASSLSSFLPRGFLLPHTPLRRPPRKRGVTSQHRAPDRGLRSGPLRKSLFSVPPALIPRLCKPVFNDADGTCSWDETSSAIVTLGSPAPPTAPAETTDDWYGWYGNPRSAGGSHCGD